MTDKTRILTRTTSVCSAPHTILRQTPPCRDDTKSEKHNIPGILDAVPVAPSAEVGVGGDSDIHRSTVRRPPALQSLNKGTRYAKPPC